MGMDPEALLAYGYDLGTSEDFKARERDKYDGPNLPWYPDDLGDDDSDDSDRGGFEEALYRKLYEAIPSPEPVEYDFQRHEQAQKYFGVTIRNSGSYDIPGWMLVIEGEANIRSVEWAEAMPLDLQLMTTRPAAGGWDAKLARVLEILDLHPTQDRPRWLVFPFYG